MFEKNGGPYPSRVTGFGHPFHGLLRWNGFQMGLLDLPNATTKNYPFMMEDGATDKFVVPGTPPVSRTLDQQARDTANGHQWLDYGILSGRNRQLYGTPLNGWLYVDPDGAIWHVDPGINTGSFPYDTAAGLSLTVTLSRFGIFSAPLEQYTYPVTLADLGQGGESDQVQIDIDSTTERGNKAIWVMRRNESDAPIPARHFAVGALEVEITGTGDAASISISVLRTRAQMFGGSESITGSAVPRDYTVDTQVQWVDGTPPCTPGDIWTEETTATGVTEQDVPPGPGAMMVGNVSDTRSVWAIIGLFFPFGSTTPEEIRVDATATTQLDRPSLSFSSSGSIEQDWVMDGACDRSHVVDTRDTLTYQLTRTITSTSSGSMTLTIGAHTISTSMSATGTTVETVTASAPGTVITSSVDRITSANTPFHNLSRQMIWSPANNFFSQPVAHIFIDVLGGTITNTSGYGAVPLLRTVVPSIGGVTLFTSTGSVTWQTQFPVLYGNRMAGAMAWTQVGNGSDPQDVIAGQPNAWLKDAVYESGTDVQLSAEVDLFQRGNGSVDPRTGAVAWGERDPVCWV